jgi:hypothetical protein
MATASTLVHLLSALRRAIGRVFLWFFLLLIVSVAVVEVIAYFAVGHPTLSSYHPAALTHVAAVVLGLALGYAGALTVIVGEVVHFLVASVHTAEREIKAEVSAPAKLISAVAQSIENREKQG